MNTVSLRRYFVRRRQQHHIRHGDHNDLVVSQPGNSRYPTSQRRPLVERRQHHLSSIIRIPTNEPPPQEGIHVADSDGTTKYKEEIVDDQQTYDVSMLTHPPALADRSSNVVNPEEEEKE